MERKITIDLSKLTMEQLLTLARILFRQQMVAECETVLDEHLDRYDRQRNQERGITMTHFDEDGSRYILIPIYSEEKQEDGSCDIILNYRKEYVD